ncbi:hypothetical protein DM02DRAFT_611495 [Periconia macrospinosa]|uniref:Uncharacterized protein n=1 Tax=Periconia macrospinosa TaxID=97972 RepID=A0A2V1E470_9PLEO|nr:hypothetical protein DM02DRAFT_611495 [Periconia macrospinosa]
MHPKWTKAVDVADETRPDETRRYTIRVTWTVVPTWLISNTPISSHPPTHPSHSSTPNPVLGWSRCDAPLPSFCAKRLRDLIRPGKKKPVETNRSVTAVCFSMCFVGTFCSVAVLKITPTPTSTPIPLRFAPPHFQTTHPHILCNWNSPPRLPSPPLLSRPLHRSTTVIPSVQTQHSLPTYYNWTLLHTCTWSE